MRIPASLQGKGKKNKLKKTTQLEPLAEFLLHTCKYIPIVLTRKLKINLRRFFNEMVRRFGVS